MKKTVLNVAALFLGVTAFAQNIQTVTNSKGPVLGYSADSGVKILTVGGNKFKDLNRNGKLDKYEDWRLPVDERAKDLASKMSIEQIAGLMLYSGHQSVPAPADGFRAGKYNGMLYKESGAKASDLTDQQKKFLKDDNLRHVLVTTVESPAIAAQWSNNIQAYIEGLGLGIPANNSTDPRHSATVTAEFNEGAGGQISLWPDGLAMGATFDPELVRKFGNIAAQEYRALGISTALSPQIDLGTEPRWYRIAYVFSESPELTADLGRGYIDGFQTTIGNKNGWGNKSVNAMVKHWPGGGPEEGGRDGHWAMGKFAVYPGNNFQNHVITDLLRGKYKYDGVVCTDWLITADEPKTPGGFAGKPWGAEKLSIAERHYKVLEAGVDQFGGNNDKGPVLEAYQMGVKEHGEKAYRAKFEQSAVRLLRNFFRTGLFENPYVNVEETKKIVGNPEFMKAGYEAQVKSIVMLKNKANVLPIKERKTVYIPKRYSPATVNWWGIYTAPSLDFPVDIEKIN